MQGRWASAGYFGVPREGMTSGSLSSLGVIHDPGHPILNGVSTFNGGSSSYRPTSLSVIAGWTRVADWSDGQPLVVTKDIGTGHVADLCFYPPSSDVRSDFWQASTDGALLMANSLVYVSGQAASPSIYDVYTGDSCGNLTRAATDLVQPTYDPPGSFQENTIYYWKVVAKNDCGDTDGPCWSFTTGFDTTPPVITHTPLADTGNATGPYNVCATVTDNMGVGAVTLYWGKNNTGTFTSVPMTASGTPNQYCGSIPGPSAVGDSYCYYIRRPTYRLRGIRAGVLRPARTASAYQPVADSVLHPVSRTTVRRRVSEYTKRNRLSVRQHRTCGQCRPCDCYRGQGRSSDT